MSKLALLFLALAAGSLPSAVLASENHAPAQAPAAEAASEAPAAHPPAPASAALTPDQVVSLLNEGNQRFVEGKAQHPSADPARREHLAADGQQPFVTVLTCSDSRTPPELIFDAGLGELFVIRVAGNIVDHDMVASAEYGCGHLNTPLLVVMGHTKCGAVTACVTNAEVHGPLAHLVAHIDPAEASARAKHPGARQDEIVRATITENIWLSVEDLLRQSSELRHLVSAGKLRVIGALYDIGTGRVKMLGRHPAEKELLADTGATRDAHAH